MRGQRDQVVAFTVANDGIAIVVNKENTWATCLTVAQLHEMWKPGSKVDNWKDISPSFPDEDLKLFGPGTDSGTFDFFTEKINGKARASRPDYFPSENDNVIVQGVSGEKGGLGYFGLSYYVENKSKLNLVKVNAGGGCVAPNIKTRAVEEVQAALPAALHLREEDLVQAARSRAFIGYILKNERAIAKRSRFVSLTDAQLELARDKYRRQATAHSHQNVTRRSQDDDPPAGRQWRRFARAAPPRFLVIGLLAALCSRGCGRTRRRQRRIGAASSRDGSPPTARARLAPS